ncbi:glycosyltransferase family 4 protein [Sphingobacterium paludis]|uniref:Glycosyltransferase involved in cell wall biosynthesis n=1 Tax=Sphingobacterium paludis TaxID=1476465 RepID=A0A4R7CYB5_9SPHI|nr:glycosyltransferase family 4 protein [Sphingobacterium paludis]TDS11114.1 glycosyltransferase involved in cell wall biosynthesis [Sphingobacterium paludis]
MRIFVIHNFYQHAGGEDQVFEQEVRELSKKHDVKAYTVKNMKGLTGAVQFLRYVWNVEEGRKIMGQVNEFQPDVVHIHNLHYSIGPLIIRRLRNRGLPVVMTLHNFRLLCPSASLFVEGEIFTDSVQQNFPWTAVKKRALDHSLGKTLVTAFVYWLHRKLGTWAQVNRYIVLSDFAKKMFAESTFPVDPARFVVRPNSMELRPIQADKNRRLLYIGRLSAEKGIMQLLNAISEMDIPLDIYGTGPQLEIVKQLIAPYPHIQYKGYQSQEVLTKAIAEADALVVPSVCYEGMPMTIIEAFAQGTAVLASEIGILKEMVVPLYTGMHFNPFQKKDIQACIVAWNELATGKKLEVAVNCRNEYAKHYTLAKNMERLLAMYKAVITEQKNK